MSSRLQNLVLKETAEAPRKWSERGWPSLLDWTTFFPPFDTTRALELGDWAGKPWLILRRRMHWARSRFAKSMCQVSAVNYPGRVSGIAQVAGCAKRPRNRRLPERVCRIKKRKGW